MDGLHLCLRTRDDRLDGGGLIEFTASATGKVYLRGRGTYELNGHEGEWNPMGEVLPIPVAAPVE